MGASSLPTVLIVSSNQHVVTRIVEAIRKKHKNDEIGVVSCADGMSATSFVSRNLSNILLVCVTKQAYDGLGSFLSLIGVPHVVAIGKKGNRKGGDFLDPSPEGLEERVTQVITEAKRLKVDTPRTTSVL